MLKKILESFRRPNKSNLILVPSSEKVAGLWTYTSGDCPKPVLSVLRDVSSQALMELCDDYWNSHLPDFKAALPDGVRAIRSYEAYVAAFNALFARGSEVVPWARERLSHPGYDAREGAAVLLGELARHGLLGDQQDAIAAKLAELAQRPWNEDTKEVQANEAAVRALASIGGPICIDTMCQILTSSHWQEDDLQWSATEVLAQVTEHPFMEAEDPVQAAKDWLDLHA